jgi:hypothetical protein
MNTGVEAAVVRQMRVGIPVGACWCYVIFVVVTVADVRAETSWANPRSSFIREAMRLMA